MLKWTASMHKLSQETPCRATPYAANAAQRRRTLASAAVNTAADKENLPFTSTPMVARTRNSPLVLAPLSDILNVTAESPMAAARTPEQRRVAVTRVSAATAAPLIRRHSTVGIAMTTAVPQYAATLPRYEEEYSPSTALPTGQQLALRGLLPDPFLGNLRYFAATEDVEQRHNSALPTKRKLEPEFAKLVRGRQRLDSVHDAKTLSSAKMGDQTLDKLIDAILDSARKDERKKKPRKSFNLRRRTLLRGPTEHAGADALLSPSYAAGDDPASDLNFLHFESTAKAKAATPLPLPLPFPLPPTPQPAARPSDTSLSDTALQQMPTPRCDGFARPRDIGGGGGGVGDDSSTTFRLATPVRPLTKRRRQQNATTAQGTIAANVSKKFKVDARQYFEIGVALPSIYV